MHAIAEGVILLLWLRLAAFTLLGAMAQRRGACGQPGAWPDDMQARLAVIVPAFNEADRIAATLHALRAQTRAPEELVVVDDGSTDATAAQAAEAMAGLAGARLIRLPRNGGKAAALNAGLAATTAELVVTVDADTRLAPDALAEALGGLGASAAAAFQLDVVPTGGWLVRLQAQEYAAALNFERRAQAHISAIAVLPGAACILRRDALPAPAFSSRTRTEDADLTLALQTRGARLGVIDAARAQTLAPATAAALFAQRVRWMAGHLQCLRHHARWRGAHWRMRLLTWPNFALSTLTTPLGLAALAVLVMSPHPGWLSPGPAIAISLALVYVQRVVARPCVDGPALVAEPLVSGSLGLLVIAGAAASLLRRRRRSHR